MINQNYLNQCNKANTCFARSNSKDFNDSLICSNSLITPLPCKLIAQSHGDYSSEYMKRLQLLTTHLYNLEAYFSNFTLFLLILNPIKKSKNFLGRTVLKQLKVNLV